MFERGAARLVTGPLAFLLAGIIDLLAFATQALRRSLTRQVRDVRARHRRGGR